MIVSEVYPLPRQTNEPQTETNGTPPNIRLGDPVGRRFYVEGNTWPIGDKHLLGLTDLLIWSTILHTGRGSIIGGARSAAGPEHHKRKTQDPS